MVRHRRGVDRHRTRRCAGRWSRELLAVRDRRLGGVTAPPQGLISCAPTIQPPSGYPKATTPIPCAACLRLRSWYRCPGGHVGPAWRTTAMRTRVKFCGLTREADVRCAVAAGADAIGLVFHPASPRAVTPDLARRLCEHLPPFVSVVGLFVDAPPGASPTGLGRGPPGAAAVPRRGVAAGLRDLRPALDQGATHAARAGPERGGTPL